MQKNRVSLLPASYKKQVNKKKQINKGQDIAIMISLILAGCFLLSSFYLIKVKTDLTRYTRQNDEIVSKIGSMREYESKNIELKNMYNKICSIQDSSSNWLGVFKNDICQLLPGGVSIESFKTSEDEANKCIIELKAQCLEQVKLTLQSFEDSEAFSSVVLTRTDVSSNSIKYALELVVSNSRRSEV